MAHDPHLDQYIEIRNELMSGTSRNIGKMEDLAYDGSIMAILFVADAMRAGTFYDQDLKGAEKWYRSACSSGSARGQTGLGLTHLLNGEFADAISNLSAACDAEYAPAMNALAGIYFRGDGTPRDFRRALELWERAVELGHFHAQRNLIALSLRGHFGPLRFIRAIPQAFKFIASEAPRTGESRYAERYR